jgi:hypothetical protein
MTSTEFPPVNQSNPRVRLMEWVFSILGAMNCIVIPIIFSYYQIQFPEGGFSNIWPFPAIYFLEIISLGVITVIAVAKIKDKQNSVWSGVPWICSGILLAFVILGAWTIGFFLIPGMILFLLVGVIVDRRIIYFVSAGIGQAILVFLISFL